MGLPVRGSYWFLCDKHSPGAWGPRPALAIRLEGRDLDFPIIIIKWR